MKKQNKQNLKSPWFLIFIGLVLVLVAGYFLLKPAPTQTTALPSEVSVAEAGNAAGCRCFCSGCAPTGRMGASPYSRSDINSIR